MSAVVELSEAEGRELFDRKCQKLLGIPGEEYVRRRNAGELAELEASNHSAVMRLEVLLPFYGE